MDHFCQDWSRLFYLYPGPVVLGLVSDPSAAGLGLVVGLLTRDLDLVTLLTVASDSVGFVAPRLEYLSSAVLSPVSRP